MQIRDRIRELRRVRAGELLPDPRNWRTHPQRQRDALQGVLAEIGYADALLARELPGGQLMLIDGHLRAETTPDAAVPVLVLDVDEAEAAKLLVTLDPLAGLATADEAALGRLLDEVKTDSAAVQTLLDDLALRQAEKPPSLDDPGSLDSRFQILITCQDEQQQLELLGRFSEEGLECRAFVV